MDGGTITGNTGAGLSTPRWPAPDIYENTKYTTINLYGGTISENTGAGIDAVYGKVTMAQQSSAIPVEIKNNKGGAITLTKNGSTANLGTGRITGNSGGKGAVALSAGSLTLTGDVKITGNTGANLYLANGKTVTLDKLGSAAEIGLTTESTAVLIPFHAQEIMQHKGMYYGQNAVSKNRIVVDRRQLLNGNSFRLGVSGSGKSMSAKEEIAQIALSTEDDILILDVESEFGHLVEAFGGEVIRISATSDTHINALDMDRAYGDERNPIVSKSEFVLSLFEQLIGSGLVTAKEKSILGRCTEQVYMPYVRNGYKGAVPTLKDFYRLLKMQPEPEAQGLALSSELFITGTLGTFAQPTNVDTKAQIIAYDIRELGEQLMPIGMLVTLDAIYNRVIQNWKRGHRTWIFCDEFYILFRYEYSANFFYKLWKRIRKYNGLITGMTQNVDELLRSDTARLMLANSEFLIMLNQSATDREELAKLLNISDTQLGYITNVPAGCGLIRCAGNLVPFTNSFPRNTQLYRLMTTKPDEQLKG